MICGGPVTLWTHRVNPGSVPFSAGTKGLECSPSTPTMNSYFYKFMINLLKRFSSERKLLEVRGAFIIRLGSVCLLFLAQPRFFMSHPCERAEPAFSLSLLFPPFPLRLFLKKQASLTPGGWCCQHETGQCRRFSPK